MKRGWSFFVFVGALMAVASVLVSAQEPSGKKKPVPQLTTDDVQKQKAGPPPNVPIDQPGEEPVVDAAAGPKRLRGPASESWFSGADGYALADRQRKQAKAVMAVYFYTDWCPYCRRLERNIFQSDEVDRYFRNVVKVRVNPEDGQEESRLARRYGITGYPSFFILPPDSESPRKITPYKKQGTGWVAMGPSDFVKACQQAASK